MRRIDSVVEFDALASGFFSMGHGGTLDGEDVTHVDTRLRRLEWMRVVITVLRAGPSSTKECSDLSLPREDPLSAVFCCR